MCNVCPVLTAKSKMSFGRTWSTFSVIAPADTPIPMLSYHVATVSKYPFQNFSKKTAVPSLKSAALYAAIPARAVNAPQMPKADVNGSPWRTSLAEGLLSPIDAFCPAETIG
jgi:hypothetical protein